MPCLVYDDQFAARPRPRKFPRGLQGAAQVESAVDEYAGGTGQAPGLPQQDPVLEPGVMAPVMGDEAREGHPEHRVVVARIMPVVWAHPNVSVLPVAPVAGGLSTDGRIGLVQQSAVRTDEVALAVGLGHAVAEACPLFGEQPTDPRVIHSISRRRPAVIPARTISETRLGGVRRRPSPGSSPRTIRTPAS